MTKKDYILISSAIKGAQVYGEAKWMVNGLSLVEDLSIKFLKDNKLFDKEKFMTACGY